MKEKGMKGERQAHIVLPLDTPQRMTTLILFTAYPFCCFIIVFLPEGHQPPEVLVRDSMAFISWKSENYLSS